MKTRYILKRNVTDEMLTQQGFEVVRGKPGMFAYTNTLFIPLNNVATFNKHYKVREINWNNRFQIDDVKPYIQGLINLGWVREETK